MPVTAADIVNEALMLMGGNVPPVIGNAPGFDNSAAGKAAALLYVPAVKAVMRQFAWDFTRTTAPLNVTGNVAPYPWQYEYQYPENCIEIWQLVPPNETDPNDPAPINYVIANAVLPGGTQARVIQTDLAAALAVFDNYPIPDIWDALFHQAVVRLLASAFATALAGKPDTAQALLQSGAAFESLGETRDD